MYHLTTIYDTNDQSTQIDEKLNNKLLVYCNRRKCNSINR